MRICNNNRQINKAKCLDSERKRMYSSAALCHENEEADLVNVCINP